MDYLPLGDTGVMVSRLSLGALRLGEWGNTDFDECVGMVSTALDHGINFVDTADLYAYGESERIVGRALLGRRDDVVLSSKFSGPMGAGVNQSGTSRRWIIQAVDASLRRLGTDWIDVYQVHRPNDVTAIEDTLGALTDLVRAGKIRYAGSSTFPAEKIVEAQWAAQRRGLERFRTEQPPYSIFTRGVERDVLPTCARYGMGVFVWGPLNGGWLSGKYRHNTSVPTLAGRVRSNQLRAAAKDPFDYSLPESRRKLDLVERLVEISAEGGMPLSHLATSFVLSHPGVTSALIGPRTPEHLRQFLAAPSTGLPDDILDRIDQVVAPGVNIDPDDPNFTPAPLRDPAARRRSAQRDQSVPSV